MTEEQARIQEFINKIFYFVFVSEILIKLIGSGVLNYLRDRYNIFDSIVIIFSTIEIVLSISDNENSKN
jgi:hypothetical protein